MIGIGYSIKNQLGSLSPIKFEEYSSYEGALKFYMANKSKLRARGLYISLVNTSS